MIIVIFEISNWIIGLKNNDVILNPRINLFENQQFGSFAVFFISVHLSKEENCGIAFEIFLVGIHAIKICFAEV